MRKSKKGWYKPWMPKGFLPFNPIRGLEEVRV